VYSRSGASFAARIITATSATTAMICDRRPVGQTRKMPMAKIAGAFLSFAAGLKPAFSDHSDP